jgi:hypothetical protein
MSEIVISMKFDLQDCPECGIQFCTPPGYEGRRRNDHGSFHCPNGHRMSFHEKTPFEIATEEKNKVQAKLNEEQHARLVLEKQLAEEKKKRATLETRISHGVCPCCNRTFKDLERHMNSKHKGGIGAGRPLKEIEASKGVN